MNSLWKCGLSCVVLFLVGVKGQGGTQPQDFVHDCLHAHNVVRAQLGEEQLRWSQKLASEAQWWAESLAQRNEFHHEPDRHWGQNLFLIEGGYSSPEQAIAAWASEANDYDARQNRCVGNICGHYTQIVWRSTREVGCAHAWRGMREVWVCDYFPAGNVVGQRPF